MDDYPIASPDMKTIFMSQVHHGGKMLRDLPAELGPPVVRVKGELFFVKELLLLESGEFFIPERYFRLPKTTTGQPGEIMSLGWEVRDSAVRSFPVREWSLVITSTSTASSSTPRRTKRCWCIPPISPKALPSFLLVLTRQYCSPVSCDICSETFILTDISVFRDMD